jgi:glycosidase
MPAPSTSPLMYEVYVRQWLHGLSVRKQRDIDLWAVPEDELDTWVSRGITHVWMMGIWPTGQKSRHQAVEHADLRRAYDDALPGWTDVDVVGSPYAVSAYNVSPSLGGDEALAALRKRLAERGIKLILDLVPNHTGLDHGWAIQKPHLYVGSPTPIPEAAKVRGVHGERYIAHGKDPYFAGWTDTLQIDYRRRETRNAMIDQIEKIAARCDGVRCDMAMLMLNEVFAKTWAHVPAMNPQGQPIEACADEFWWSAIAATKQKYPGFLFLAEAYWDLEERLCELGFDYAYDKRLYDLLLHGDWGVAGHLQRLGGNNHKRAHFLENHDEPRANTAIPFAAHKGAALLTLSLPGMRFLHDGQLEGRRRFARIQLARTAVEEKDAAVAGLYAALFEVLPQTAIGRGECQILDTAPAWDGNHSHNAYTLVQWQQPGDASSFDVVVVNHSRDRAQCYARLNAQGLRNGKWVLKDRLSIERHERDGPELLERGLFLDTPGHAAQLFSFKRA